MPFVNRAEACFHIFLIFSIYCVCVVGGGGEVTVRPPTRRVGPKFLLIGSYVRDPRCTHMDRGPRSVPFQYLWILPGGGTGLDQRNASVFWCFLVPRADARARGALGLCMEVGKTPRDMAQPGVSAGVEDRADVLRPLTTPPSRRLRRLFSKKA